MRSREQAASVLHDALASISRHDIRYAVMPGPGDQVSVVGPTGVEQFAVRWAGEGFPRDVDRATQSPSKHRILVAAKAFFSGAISILKDRGYSFVDAVGNLEILTPQPTLVRTVANPVSEPVTTTWRWSPASSAVAELLLTQQVGESRPQPVPSLGELQAHLPLSRGMLSRTLSAFDDQGWTIKTGALRGRTSGRQLVDPAGMLDSWARWDHTTVLAKRPILTAAFWQDPSTFLEGTLVPALDNLPYALTGWLGAAQLAPFVTSIPTIELYVPWDALPSLRQDLPSTAGLREVEESAARVRLLAAEPAILERSQTSNELPLASTVRIYADLLRSGVRKAAAASTRPIPAARDLYDFAYVLLHNRAGGPLAPAAISALPAEVVSGYRHHLDVMILQLTTGERPAAQVYAKGIMERREDLPRLIEDASWAAKTFSAALHLP